MSTTGLKRVLGLPEVTFIAIGFTIGAGVFVFTGIVARLTGPALPLAYGLAVIPVFISMLPLAMLGAALPCTGGNYRYPSRMVSPGLAFVGIWVYVLASFFGQIPLYALSCATYVSEFIPGLSPNLFAILLLTFFYLLNLFGIRLAAQVQGVMVIMLIAALLTFTGAGLPRLQPQYFQDFAHKGLGNIALGVALLTFTYFGANSIIELGGEIVNPGRTIPRALFIAFPLITIIYLLVAITAVGTVSWGELAQAKEPLVSACRTFMGSAGTTFFIVGGAILALTTTLNALFIIGTKSLLIIVADGILPGVLGRTNRRFGTAHILLTCIWALSILGVLSGFSLQTFASYATLGGMIIFVPVLLAAMVLPKRYPGPYAASGFKLRGFWLVFCPVVGFVMVAFFGTVILADLGSLLKVILFPVFILSGVGIYRLRKRQLARQGIDLMGRIRGESWVEQAPTPSHRS